jgi:hypothetical protein
MKSGGRNLHSTWNPEIPPALAEMDKHTDYGVIFLQNTRGEEAADVIQPQRLDLLFHQHSKPWRAIADEYLSNCRDHYKRFLNNLTITILEPELRHIAKQIQEKQLDKHLEKRMQEALAELGEMTKGSPESKETRNEAFLNGTRSIWKGTSQNDDRCYFKN